MGHSTATRTSLSLYSTAIPRKGSALRKWLQTNLPKFVSIFEFAENGLEFGFSFYFEFKLEILTVKSEKRNSFVHFFNVGVLQRAESSDAPQIGPRADLIKKISA